MTIEEIRELIGIVQASGVAELEVQRGENRVRIRRNVATQAQEFVLAAAPQQVAAPSVPVASSAPGLAMPAAPPAAEPGRPVEPETDENIRFAESPIVGTFYESASPDTPPFVKVGDRVSKGQVLCIIESMKLMNEIESEYSGTVVRKLVENGKPVEYGQPLFAIRPE